MRRQAGPCALLGVHPGILAALAIAALALGCGSESPTGGESAPAPESAAPGAEAPVPPPPKAQLSEGELPSDYPSDLPIYPGATASASLGIPGAPMLVTFDSEDSVGEILDHLSKELEEEGWSVNEGDGGKLEATKDERNAIFHVSAEPGGGSIIAVFVTQG